MYKENKQTKKMDKKIIKFDDTEIKKYKFHQNKSAISKDDIDINKVVVSIKLPSHKQHFIYFIDYKDDKKLHLYAYSFPK